LNIAFGRVSSTVAVTSIASSFDISYRANPVIVDKLFMLPFLV
jgi:hypothetical protein